MVTAARSLAVSALIALAMAASCAGCAPAAPPLPQTIVAKVPVPEPVYCDAPIPARPALPIAALHPASPPADTVRAYAASVVVLKAAVVEREQLLAGCMAPERAANSQPGSDRGSKQ